MKRSSHSFHRRQFLTATAGLAVLPVFGSAFGSGGVSTPITRPIPSTGDLIPAIGMGTWITFNVGDDEKLRRARLQVLKTFFALGGGMVDSSPMYGTAQDVLGWCLSRIEAEDQQGLLSATKIWSPAGGTGAEQVSDAERLWQQDTIDLMQIHNLVDWEEHLALLQAMKAEGRIRYIGITMSHGSRHQRLAEIMETQPIDFVQFTYNIQDRAAESRLLPLAKERGLGVIINRPFRRGGLFKATAGEPLPAWAAEIGATSWAQIFLKFVISHPIFTCAIPATSQVEHMTENMGVLNGPLPDATLRRRMANDFADL